MILKAVEKQDPDRSLEVSGTGDLTREAESLQRVQTMSMPAGMGTFTARPKKAGNSGDRVDGQDLSRGAVKGLIGASQVSTETSAPEYEETRDPGISVEQREDMAATLGPEAAVMAWAVEITEAAKVVFRGTREPFRAADEEVFRAVGAEASKAGEDEGFREDTGNRKI